MPYDEQVVDGVATRCHRCGGVLDADENCPPCDEAKAEATAEAMRDEAEEEIRTELAQEHADTEPEKDEPLDPEDREALNNSLSKDD